MSKTIALNIYVELTPNAKLSGNEQVELYKELSSKIKANVESLISDTHGPKYKLLEGYDCDVFVS